jgi:hydroxymethylbilane synthase
MKVRIGTRGSKLALWQAYYVEERLKMAGLQTEIVTIETKGDQILDRSLSKIGSKGVFTQELEDQLRSGKIDIAVHSAKDLQSELDDDLEIIAFTERERVNDVLVSFDKNITIHNPHKPITIGTSSTRRVALMRHFYPHIHTTDMRGNLQTRFRKLEQKHCDALLLAYAGVHRMGYDEYIVEYLHTTQFTPAVGQGSVAIEAAKNIATSKKQQIRKLLNHTHTEICLAAERAFLSTLQGGCSVPVFGLATLQNNQLDFTGGVVSLDGKTLLKINKNSALDSPTSIGEAVANELLAAGAGEILAQIKNENKTQ